MARDEGRSSGSRPPQQITKRSCSCPYVHLILLFFVLHITGYYANIIVGMIVVLSTEVPSWLPIPYSSEVPYNSINCRHLNINFIQKSTNITSESACTSSTWIERLLLAFFLPSFLPCIFLSLLLSLCSFPRFPSTYQFPYFFFCTEYCVRLCCHLRCCWHMVV